MTNVIELFPANQSKQENDMKAEKAFLEYLAWSMKFESDPHDKYDDPVAEFREQSEKSTDVA
ncbi:MAG: hypothetical protein C9356_16710 [Oleiphilus sp.]|nr:MAG: hypothetical protein C9356_16710 [Oleiphilus sp.]